MSNMVSENKIQEISDMLEKKANLYWCAYSHYDGSISQLLKKILSKRIDDYETDCCFSGLAGLGVDLLCGKNPKKPLENQKKIESKVQKFRGLIPLVDQLPHKQKNQMFEMIGHKPVDDLFEFLESFTRLPEAITIDVIDLNLIPIK